MQNIKPSNFLSVPSQAESLAERHGVEITEKQCGSFKVKIFPGVYRTSIDTELMIGSVKISPNETFLEVGCGSGIISVSLANNCLSGVGVDINEGAVLNSIENARMNGAPHLTFLKSNLFENVSGQFDVIICNPPYTNHPTNDDIEKMFWDEGDKMKRDFFLEVKKYLKPNGRIYFGWANFADIDSELPFRLANNAGFTSLNVFERPSKHNEFSFYVIEFKTL